MLQGFCSILVLSIESEHVKAILKSFFRDKIPKLLLRAFVVTYERAKAALVLLAK